MVIYRGYMFKELSPGKWEIKDANNKPITVALGSEEAVMNWIDKKKKEPK